MKNVLIVYIQCYLNSFKWNGAAPNEHYRSITCVLHAKSGLTSKFSNLILNSHRIFRANSHIQISDISLVEQT